MINDVRATARFLSGALLFIFTSFCAFADDPGITKVRLIQQTDTSYLFEADVPQMVLSSIKKPILPERFSYTDFELSNQSGWITLQTVISTSGRPFDKEDEILLPWLRNGVDFTAQWKEGGTFKGLFTRTLKGIHIPLSEVMPSKKSTAEVLSEGMQMAIRHVRFKWIHIVFIFMLTWIIGSFSRIYILLWWSLGQGLAMILSELGVPGVDMLFSDVLLLLLTLLMAYAIAYNMEFKFLWIALLITGTVHALSFVNETQALGFTGIQKIHALFAFNLPTDIFHFLLACAFLFLAPLIKKFIKDRNIAILTGGISIMLMLFVFADNISTGNVQILSDLKASAQSVRLPAPAKQSLQQVQRGTGLMTSPIMAYVSIAPYEIRQEVLLEASALLEAFYPDFQDEVIPLDLQRQLKSMLVDTLQNSSTILLDGQSIQSVEVRANFVRLTRGGVTIRETPIGEEIEHGIIGVTMIYDIPTLPEAIRYNWNFFPGEVDHVEASIVDPYGVMSAVLSNDERVMHWKNRLSGSDLLTVAPIQIAYYPLPLVSIFLWLGLLIYLMYGVAFSRQIKHKAIVISCIALGFVLYPFLRTERAMPFLSKWKPSEERSANILSDLLTNVYRAFDRRKEDDVYGRLAMSVTGEQLTEIYLSNRQAMALENRGGARANVDEVKMLEIYDVEHASEGGFTADASWTVRGSVNHFGHTHYRQNQYRALVTFVDDNDSWKISSIETIEEKRVY